MNLELTFTLGNLITIISGVLIISGIYWKLREGLKERPIYIKVEDMIKKQAMQREETEELIEKELDKCRQARITEVRVESIIARDAYPKNSGNLLEQRLNQIADTLEEIKRLIKNNH